HAGAHPMGQRCESGLRVPGRRLRLRPQHLYQYAAAQGRHRGHHDHRRRTRTRPRRRTLHDLPDRSRCGGLLIAFGHRGEEAMRAFAAALVLLLSAAGVTGVRAADYSVAAQKAENYQPVSWLPTVSVVGTVSATWTDNALFSRDNRQSDWFFEPDVSLRLDGRLTPDLTYRLYARTEFEKFAHVRDGDNAFALWGARLTRDIA